MSKIEWCDETINPLGWGCYGPGGTAEKPKRCPWCYAEVMAKRNMRDCELCNQFAPHEHFEQLEKLWGWKKPKNIFVQSMGDLFHPFVPDEWIHKVLDACLNIPRHRYLFLTQNPERYWNFEVEIDRVKGNMWAGATAYTLLDVQNRVHAFDMMGGPKFLSIEPIQEDVAETLDCDVLDWVIVGAETGSRPGKTTPKREWIEGIVEKCRKHNTPLFVKNNLAPLWDRVYGLPLQQDFPWEVEI